MESFRELTDTELDAVSGGAAAAAAGTGTVAVAAATNSPTVSALLFNVGGDFVNNDGPGAIAFTK
jgi:bacteriocin-like protein